MLNSKIQRNFNVIWEHGEYKELSEYPNYWIFADGTIYSLYKHRTIGVKHYKNGKDGYFKMTATIINSNGEEVTMSVHRLVAMAFCPADKPKHFTEVHHINGDTADNSIYNLIWTAPLYHKIIECEEKRYKKEGIYTKCDSSSLSFAFGKALVSRDDFIKFHNVTYQKDYYLHEGA